MTEGCILDASAIPCLPFREPGSDTVESRLAGSRVSAVNRAEVVAKLVDRGVADEAMTRRHGLSLGDRCRLALAKADAVEALTTDRAWTSLDIGAAVAAVR